MSEAVRLLNHIRRAVWKLSNHEGELPDEVFSYFEDEYTTIEDLVALAEAEIEEGDGEDDDGDATSLLPDGGSHFVTIDADSGTVHRALAGETRHLILELMDQHETVHFERLVEFLAERTGARPEKLQTELHHTHLPVLDAAGALGYDAETQEVGERIVTATDETGTFADIAVFVDTRTGGADE